MTWYPYLPSLFLRSGISVKTKSKLSCILQSTTYISSRQNPQDKILPNASRNDTKYSMHFQRFLYRSITMKLWDTFDEHEEYWKMLLYYCYTCLRCVPYYINNSKEIVVIFPSILCMYSHHNILRIYGRKIYNSTETTNPFSTDRPTKHIFQ